MDSSLTILDIAPKKVKPSSYLPASEVLRVPANIHDKYLSHLRAAFLARFVGLPTNCPSIEILIQTLLYIIDQIKSMLAGQSKRADFRFELFKSACDQLQDISTQDLLSCSLTKHLQNYILSVTKSQKGDNPLDQLIYKEVVYLASRASSTNRVIHPVVLRCVELLSDTERESIKESASCTRISASSQSAGGVTR